MAPFLFTIIHMYPLVMNAKKFPKGKNETLFNIKTISKIL